MGTEDLAITLPVDVVERLLIMADTIAEDAVGPLYGEAIAIARQEIAQVKAMAGVEP